MMLVDQREQIQPTCDLGQLRAIGNGPSGFSERAHFVNSLPNDRRYKKCVVVFSTPRSGSTLLCDQLASTGLVGAPDEWLNPIWLNTVGRAKFASCVSEALQWAACRTSTTNGIFSINVQIDHYINLKNKGFDILKWGIDDAIYLERKDKLQQAYSLAKARMYGKWEQTNAPGEKEIDELDVPMFAILKALSDVYFWSDYFAKVLQPHTSKTITYEDYLSDSQIVLDLVAHFSGTHLDSLSVRSKLKKQQTEKDRTAIELLRAKISL